MRRLRSSFVRQSARAKCGSSIVAEESALVIFERTYGCKHYEVAVCLNNLAAIKHSQGKSKEAENLYKRALAIKEKVLGSDNPDLALTRFDKLVAIPRETLTPRRGKILYKQPSPFQVRPPRRGFRPRARIARRTGRATGRTRAAGSCGLREAALRTRVAALAATYGQAHGHSPRLAR